MTHPMHPIVWREEGWYFQGDLAAGRAYVERDYLFFYVHPRNEHGLIAVEICTIKDDPASANEYGVAPTEDEAVRLAIGAYFGGSENEPIDSVWESRVIAMLQVIKP